jgi:hypothetical protein
MGFLARLFGPLFGKAPTGSGRYLTVYALSHRCHEAVTGQIDLMNEISLDDEGKGGYYVRKVLHTSGKGRCFAEVEIEAWLDGNKRLLRQEVHGGRALTADEYAAEVERAEQAEREAAEQAAAEQAAAEQGMADQQAKDGE